MTQSSPRAFAHLPAAFQRQEASSVLASPEDSAIEDVGVLACDELSARMVHCALSLERNQAQLLFNLVDDLNTSWRQAAQSLSGAELLERMCHGVAPTISGLITQFGCR